MLPTDLWLSPLPLYHVGGLAALFRCCLFGAALVLQNGFDLDEVMHRLHNEKITLVSFVPVMLYRLLNQVNWRDTALRAVLLGGAAAPEELLQQSLAAGVPVALTYGLTEAASQVATLHPKDVLRKPGSVGKGLIYTSIRVIDQQGVEQPSGEIGEVLVSGSTVMAGYYGDPEATSQVIRAGWLHTGDMGYLDSDGDLWIIQRRSDLIVSGGENVYPVEVEKVLHKHPAVAEACVVGLSDPEWGQRVAAMVVVKTGCDLKEEALLSFARSLLAGYKQPRQICFVSEIPRTSSGKVDRQRVRLGMQNDCMPLENRGS